MKALLPWLAAASFALLTACGSGPTIEHFTADKSQVSYGETVTLSWTVKDADTISINGQTVNGTSATATPEGTTQYVLTATNSHGATQSAPVTVTVGAGLRVQGGTYNSGGLGSTYLVRLRDANGQPQGVDTNISLTRPDGTSTVLACAGGEPLCLYTDDAKPLAGTYTAQATLGSDTLQGTFTIDPTSKLATPQVTANVNGASTAIDASWTAVSGAALYVAQVFDLDSGDALSDPANTTGTQISLPLTGSLNPDGNYGVAVSAFAVNALDANPPSKLPAPNASRTLGYLQNLPGSHWSLFGPSDYSGGQLTVNLSNLDPTEHLAVLIYNLGAQDLDPSTSATNATLTITGVSPSVVPAGTLNATSPATTSPNALRTAVPGTDDQAAPETRLRRWALRGHEKIRAKEDEALAELTRLRKEGALPPASLTAPHPQALRTAAAQTSTTFCVQQDSGAFVRKSATLMKESARALFYADDDDLSEYSGSNASMWDQLGTLWDDTIYPTDTGTFGAESDVDGNGKLIILFTHELGPAVNGAITLGYYWAKDVINPRDETTGCTAGGQGSNGADMFYMNDLNNLTDGAPFGSLADQVISTNYPDTLAHEFQHLINFNQKHLVRDQPASESVWINEGLSVTAEDLVGFGWNNAGGRSDGNAYLTDLPLSSNNPFLRYFNTAFFKWEGDPIGDYQGAHTFFRYFADRQGDATLGNIVQSDGVGPDNVAAALGEPFERAFGEWATALMFSNEVTEPSSRFNYTGSNWNPLHLKLSASSACDPVFPYPNRPGYVQYRTFSSGTAKAALRTGGWNAFVTGAGLSGPVSLTVSPSAGIAPYVVVVRFSGNLPDGRQAACQ